MATTDTRQPIYETLLIGILLAAVGGYMDAFTYMSYGEVFSSLQSGNVILLGINLASGHFAATWRYFIPILFFAFGAGFANLIEQFYVKKDLFIWQQINLLIELLGIALIGLIDRNIPQLFVTSSLSFFAAFQVHTYRRLNGHPFSTTMTTGNVKSIGSALFGLLFTKGSKKANRILFTDSLLIVIGFGLGAFTATLLRDSWHAQTILGAAFILLIVFMLTQYDLRRHPENY
ncbi:hypothetical protein FC83_GL001393 [Agrilactobacillus composti DSM 18527 = JCM 14202]|uniref:DUF1275 domain-containing protein n=1 Tax=Agrilactobacillus composti DSM 18527 = JCM 14202 TaxID=1423734 RepID=A0A0R1XVL4_9LACO|nr:YoaK family protein [Agrilactobacillus composti]KRM30835.1 hypothetical protein FC83_GL001393 [Agrilactobacillus composti DSM 18527 = JCM 14202]